VSWRREGGGERGATNVMRSLRLADEYYYYDNNINKYLQSS